MNLHLRIPTLILIMLPFSGVAQVNQQKDSIAVINRSSQRLSSGDISALDDVKALPGDDAVKGLLLLFSNHYRVFRGTKTQEQIALRAAQYFTECQTTKSYTLRMFRKDPNRQASPRLARQREIVLDCLGAAKNRFALEIMFELIDDPNLDVSSGDIGLGLARADIQGAPYSRKASQGTTSAEGITKWKEWWKSSRDSFPQ